MTVCQPIPELSKPSKSQKQALPLATGCYPPCTYLDTYRMCLTCALWLLVVVIVVVVVAVVIVVVVVAAAVDVAGLLLLLLLLLFVVEWQ